jgi:hypothetical protein
MSSNESINRIVDGACNKKNAAMRVGMNSGIYFTHFEAQSSGTNLLFSPALGLDTCEGEGESYQLFGALLAFSLSFGTLIPKYFVFFKVQSNVLTCSAHLVLKLVSSVADDSPIENPNPAKRARIDNPKPTNERRITAGAPGFTGPPGIFSGFAFSAGSPRFAGPSGVFPDFTGSPTGSLGFTSTPNNSAPSFSSSAPSFTNSRVGTPGFSGSPDVDFPG